MGDDSVVVFFCFVLFFLGVVIAVFLSIEEMDSVLSLVGMGKPYAITN